MVCGKALIATIFGTASATAGNITTIAGGYEGDNGLAASAALDLPSGMALDGAGNLYIADTGNNVIRKITAATGVITAGDTVNSPLAALPLPRPPRSLWDRTRSQPPTAATLRTSPALRTR